MTRAAPILSQVPTGPQRDSNADPGKGDAHNGKSVGPMDNAMAKNADPRRVAEEQYKAQNFQEKHAETRRGGLPADGPSRLQRTHRPIYDKDDPRTFNEIMPNHDSMRHPCFCLLLAAHRLPFAVYRFASPKTS